MSPFRRALALLVVAAAGALLPATAARADDRSFATAAVRAAQSLIRYERATGTALVRVDNRGRSAIPAARRAAAQTRRQIDRVLPRVRRESTSTPDGKSTKRRFVGLLVREKKAYKTIDSSLAAFQRGDVSTGNTLQARAKRALEQVRREAVRVGGRLRALLGA